MTENMNSLCNADAIRSLIEENKKIEEEIGTALLAEHYQTGNAGRCSIYVSSHSYRR
ncbi:MAG: hypothetical protein ACI4W2_02315 [Eubacterium sp.]